MVSSNSLHWFVHFVTCYVIRSLFFISFIALKFVIISSATTVILFLYIPIVSFHFSVKDFDIPKSVAQCRAKLKENFLKNKDVKDIRVIDILVIKVWHYSQFHIVFSLSKK